MSLYYWTALFTEHIWRLLLKIWVRFKRFSKLTDLRNLSFSSFEFLKTRTTLDVMQQFFQDFQELLINILWFSSILVFFFFPLFPCTLKYKKLKNTTNMMIQEQPFRFLNISQENTCNRAFYLIKLQPVGQCTLWNFLRFIKHLWTAASVNLSYLVWLGMTHCRVTKLASCWICVKCWYSFFIKRKECRKIVSTFQIVSLNKA